MKRIGVTGASGFIGSELVTALRQRGDFVRAFVRNLNAAKFPNGVQARQLDLAGAGTDEQAAACLEELDAIVHLSGEPIAGRWTREKKRKIHDSRQTTTRNLVAAMRECSKRPRTLICASGAGYYGSRGDEPLTEASPPGDDFLARVCVDWESEANRAAEFGTRVVCVRQAPVMGARGGALEAMLPPFRIGAGGPLGSGRQWWPWIHLDDDISLILFILDREDVSGPINAVSPDLATNARFARALGVAMRRPSLAYAPAPALKAILGEFADALLASQLVLPARAQDLGFGWKHGKLEEALLGLLDPNSRRAPGTYRFVARQKLATTPQRVAEFFSNAANLALLTPPAMQLRILTPQPIEMRRGAIIEYELKLRGLPLHWKTLVTSWQRDKGFEDVQLRGPYLLWRHRHDFQPEEDGVVVSDAIEYALPLAPLSNVALPMVRSELQRLFSYRRDQARRLIGL